MVSANYITSSSCRIPAVRFALQDCTTSNYTSGVIREYSDPLSWSAYYHRVLERLRWARSEPINGTVVESVKSWSWSIKIWITGFCNAGSMFFYGVSRGFLGTAGESNFYENLLLNFKRQLAPEIFTPNKIPQQVITHQPNHALRQIHAYFEISQSKFHADGKSRDNKIPRMTKSRKMKTSQESCRITHPREGKKISLPMFFSCVSIWICSFKMS